MRNLRVFAMVSVLLTGVLAAEEWHVPYSSPATKRENVFAFTAKPKVKLVARDKYEVTFGIKGACDVAVGLIDKDGKIVRHLAAGVLGANAPEPFQKNTLDQKIHWNGKDDLGYYVKEPEKLRVRVQLGLKPVFHKMLGPSDPHNLPGYVLGIGIDKDGAYVFSRGKGAHNNVHLRKFDRDGKYLMTLAPPPSNLSLEKVAGRGSIEYAPEKISHHGPEIPADMGYDGNVLPGLGGMSIADLQPAVIKKRIFFTNTGPSGYSGKGTISTLFYVYTDGSTDVRGMKGTPLGAKINISHIWPRFASSPDGKWLYMIDMTHAAVFRGDVDGGGELEPFIGNFKMGRGTVQSTMGSDNKSLNAPKGIDVDSKGRIYIGDSLNNRIQIFSPDGKHLKTIKIDRPRLVKVHPKTNAIYVQHLGRVKGRTVSRVTKLTSFDKPEPEYFIDGYSTSCMALDSWSRKPRVWVAGGLHRQGSTTTALYADRGPSVIILEDTGKEFKQIMSFDETWKKAAGKAAVFGRWSASVFDHVHCDPNREQLYYGVFRAPGYVFDLETGEYLKTIHFPGALNDIDFCKRGYMHMHFDPGFFMPGVGRIDPGQQFTHYATAQPPKEMYREVPYDYGIATDKPRSWNWIGAIPVKDQPGAKYFQDGFGVNMRGDIAVQSNIYYVPKMEEAGWGHAAAGTELRRASGVFTGPSRYSEFMRSIQEQQKRGETVYNIPRRPGTPLAGATVWVYDGTGELRTELAVTAGSTMAGARIDEDGSVYFVSLRSKMINGKPFLHQRGGTVGSKETINRYNKHPFTGTLMKTDVKNLKFLLANAKVQLDPQPTRPADVCDYDSFGSPQTGNKVWVEGATWMYAGVSPGVAKGCTCASTRFQLDWFKRSYVGESYRHTIGIVDTNGNLIAHIGRYGNLDDVLKAKPGAEDFGLTMPRFISGTDNFLAFDDWGERIVTLKLKYHTEAVAAIRN
ncbi:hypothetical protein ACFL01_01770 [Planctomycetota bacterium]